MQNISKSSVAIQKALAERRNFAVVAGAGAGKTGSLVRALLDIRSLYGRDFRRDGQKVACITYTNVAVDVITRRTDADDLFLVSTIHGFLWSIIGHFEDDLRRVLKEEIIPGRIEKKRKDAKGESKTAQAARAQIDRLEAGLAAIETVESIRYDAAGRRNYAKGQLDHDDVIDVASSLLTQSPVLQRIVGQQFPVILVDEAQDTFPSVMNALNSIVAQPGFPILGYFGDPMQQIFENRTGRFSGPPGTETIKIKENFRCSKEVIKLLNKVRTDIEQEPGPDNVEGSVAIILVSTEEGRGYRKAYDEEQLLAVRKKFENALKAIGWADEPMVKMLFLTRQMIAQRLGFASLNRLFTGDFSSKAAEDDFKNGTHFLLAPFVDTLIPVINAKRKSDGDGIMQALVKRSPLLRPDGKNKFTPFGKVVEQVLYGLDGIPPIPRTLHLGAFKCLGFELYRADVAQC